MMPAWKTIPLFPCGRRQWGWAIGRITFLIVALMSGLFFLVRMPVSSFSGPLPELTADERLGATILRRHVETLAEKIGPRTIWQPASMQATVAYLEKELAALGYHPACQHYEVRGMTAANLEVEIRGIRQPDEIVVVGAHYDTVAGSPGANDNGSGVAALLELARLCSALEPARTVRFVFFANEEPPFFFSDTMGSTVYAARCRERKERIIAMLSLETMGCYRDEPASQRYPFPFSLLYPDTGNFIAFVGNIRSHQLVREAIGAFRRHAAFPSEGLAAPGFVPGVGWSDHLSFWREGYPAIMVTDTAFYRYAPYHSEEDTAEKLDYGRLVRVVGGLVSVVMVLAQ